MPDFSQIELRSAIYRNYLYRAIWLKYTCYDTGPRFTALSHPEDHYLVDSYNKPWVLTYSNTVPLGLAYTRTYINL